VTINTKYSVGDRVALEVVSSIVFSKRLPNMTVERRTMIFGTVVEVHVRWNERSESDKPFHWFGYNSIVYACDWDRPLPECVVAANQSAYARNCYFDESKLRLE